MKENETYAQDLKENDWIIRRGVAWSVDKIEKEYNEFSGETTIHGVCSREDLAFKRARLINGTYEIGRCTVGARFIFALNEIVEKTERDREQFSWLSEGKKNSRGDGMTELRVEPDSKWYYPEESFVSFSVDCPQCERVITSTLDHGLESSYEDGHGIITFYSCCEHCDPDEMDEIETRFVIKSLVMTLEATNA